jgi:DNA polymerase-1
MVTVEEFLCAPDGRGSRLLLQVHDELVIEAPEHEAEALAPNIKSLMEGAATLSIPLTVEVGIGRNWGEA